MPGRSILNAICLLWQLKLYREKKDFYMVFIDSKTKYDRLSRDLWWHILEKRGLNNNYFDLIKYMYVTTIIYKVDQ